jgi:hypothetical protein
MAKGMGKPAARKFVLSDKIESSKMGFIPFSQDKTPFISQASVKTGRQLKGEDRAGVFPGLGEL